MTRSRLRPNLRSTTRVSKDLALLHVVVADVALLLEEAGDLDLHPRARHGCVLVQRLVGVADAGEHVCDRIGQHRFSPTSSTSSCRESRPGAPARGGRSGRAELAEDRARAAAPVAARVVAHLVLLGSPLLHDERRLSPLLIPSFAIGRERQAEARSSARACSSVSALVVIVTSSRGPAGCRRS
jgi:hypothetical protein